MKRALLGLIICVLTLSFMPLWSFPKVPGVSGRWDFSCLGYRQDEFKFSIADPSGFPNVLNEVNWRDIHSFPFMTKGHITAWDHIYLQGAFDFAWIRRGRVRDSYFAGDNRTDEFARFEAIIPGGSLFDLSGGIGVNIFPWRRGIILAPLVGYSLNGQNLKISKATETIADDPANLGPICGLRVNYRSRWEGPWVGLDFSVKPTCYWMFEAGYQYHWARFRARGKWELTDCLDPNNFFVNNFWQDAHGSGMVVNFGTSYYFDETWGLGIYGNFQRWKTRPNGKNTSDICRSVNTLPADQQFRGTFPITCGTALNSVIWNSFMICLEFSAEF